MLSCLQAHAQHQSVPVAQAPSDSSICNLPSSASYLRRFVPSPFFVLSDTCCLRMLSSSALRSLPGQAQIRASKQRRPKTCPLGREVRRNISWHLGHRPAAPLNFIPHCASPISQSRFPGCWCSHLQTSKKYPIAP